MFCHPHQLRLAQPRRDLLRRTLHGTDHVDAREAPRRFVARAEVHAVAGIEQVPIIHRVPIYLGDSPGAKTTVQQFSTLRRRRRKFL